MIDELPPDAMGVQITDEGCRLCGERPSIIPISDTRDCWEGCPYFQGMNKTHSGFLPFTPDDKIDLRFVCQDFSPVIGWEYAPIDDPHFRQCPAQSLCNCHHDRMAGSRSGMAYENSFWRKGHRLFHTMVNRWRTKLCIQKLYIMTCINKRAAHR